MYSVKSTVKISSIVVAFLENMNIIYAFFLERIRKTLKILIWLDILIDAYLLTEFSNTVHKI